MSRLGDMTPKPVDLSFFAKDSGGRESGAEIQTLPLSLVVESDQLCLRSPPYPGVNELAASIKESGQSTPLFVRPTDSGSYELISGYRRLAALQAIESPSALVRIFRDLSEAEAYKLAISENADRNDLTDWERARACERMRTDGLDKEEIAKRFHWKNKKNVENHLRLVREAPKSLVASLQKRDLAISHAISLLQSLANYEISSERRDEVIKIVANRKTPVSRIPALLKTLLGKKVEVATPAIEGWHCTEQNSGAITFRGHAKPDDAEQLDELANELASLLRKVRAKRRKLLAEQESDLKPEA